MVKTSNIFYCYRIVKRRDAKKENLKNYYTAKLCVNGHDSLRLTSTGECVTCARLKRAKWLSVNRDKLNTKERENNKKRSAIFSHLTKVDLKKYLGWLEATGFIETKEQARENKNPYYRDGTVCWNDHYSVYSTRSRKLKCLHCKREDTFKRGRKPTPRTDEQRLRTRESVKRWATLNPERYKTLRDNHNIFRHKRLKEATPNWLSSAHKLELKGIYKKRDELKRSTNTDYHVDHIVPISNPIVCGLHVPWNLRVVTKKENKEKANKFVGEFY